MFYSRVNNSSGSLSNNEALRSLFVDGKWLLPCGKHAAEPDGVPQLPPHSSSNPTWPWSTHLRSLLLNWSLPQSSCEALCCSPGPGLLPVKVKADTNKIIRTFRRFCWFPLRSQVNIWLFSCQHLWQLSSLLAKQIICWWQFKAGSAQFFFGSVLSLDQSISISLAWTSDCARLYVKNVSGNQVGCFSKAATLMHFENWSPASAKLDEAPSFAPGSYYHLLFYLINNTFALCIFFPLISFLIFWTICGNRMQIGSWRHRTRNFIFDPKRHSGCQIVFLLWTPGLFQYQKKPRLLIWH